MVDGCRNDPARARGLLPGWRAILPAAACAAMLLAAVPVAAKDVDPTRPSCDSLAKHSAAWTQCAERVADDHQRFYAGYWLAKGGQYHAALDQLRAIAAPDARVLTYIGFSLRKLGETDEALAYYARALAADPGFTVARAYLGEAHLTLGDRARAASELAEIERRCGRSCEDYVELASQIDAYDQQLISASRKS